MALRFPLALTSAILSCALVGPIVPRALSEPVPAGSAPLTIGRAVYPLNGPWKFQIGDSPIDPAANTPLWAEPGFDDSNWETMDLTSTEGASVPVVGSPGYVPGWTRRGHPGYLGWAWYRLRVPVMVEAGRRIAIDGPFWVNDAFQLYADGELLV
jgi:hypothetical protein